MKQFAPLIALAFTLSGCDGGTTYDYFESDVGIDPAIVMGPAIAAQGAHCANAAHTYATGYVYSGPTNVTGVTRVGAYHETTC